MSHATRVLQDHGGVPLKMVFLYPDLQYVTGLLGDDLACVGNIETLLNFEGVLLSNFEATRIGIFGPSCPGHVKLLNREIAWAENGFEWHTDMKHSFSVCERLGLKADCTPSATPESKEAGNSIKDGEDFLIGEEKAL